MGEENSGPSGIQPGRLQSGYGGENSTLGKDSKKPPAYFEHQSVGCNPPPLKGLFETEGCHLPGAGNSGIVGEAALAKSRRLLESGLHRTGTEGCGGNRKPCNTELLPQSLGQGKNKGFGSVIHRHKGSGLKGRHTGDIEYPGNSGSAVSGGLTLFD